MHVKLSGDLIKEDNHEENDNPRLEKRFLKGLIRDKHAAEQLSQAEGMHKNLLESSRLQELTYTRNF